MPVPDAVVRLDGSGINAEEVANRAEQLYPLYVLGPDGHLGSGAWLWDTLRFVSSPLAVLPAFRLGRSAVSLHQAATQESGPRPDNTLGA